MSDTPMTDEAQFGTGRVSVDFARRLERELNAANERIMLLEEAGDELGSRLRLRDEADSDAYLKWLKAKEAKL